MSDNHAVKRIKKWVIYASTLFLLIIGIIGVSIFILIYFQGQKELPTDGEYVSLGSSFAAGPGVGEREEGSPWLCHRSDRNYAKLVSDKMGYKLVDASCSGAVTANILTKGNFFTPAQIEAVTDRAKLVTLTIGGNDASYMGNLYAWSHQEEAVPLAWHLSGMTRVTPDSEVTNSLAELETNLEAIIHEIKERAPKARIILIDYLPILKEIPHRLQAAD